MMTVNQDTIKAQLPPGSGAQLASGDSGKEIAGVIDASLGGDRDVLRRQALMIARARGGIAYDNIGQLSDEFINEHLQRAPEQLLNRYQRNITTDTISSLLTGSLQRDQQYVGGNADWTGYYLEQLAKFMQPFDTPVKNMLPRAPSVGIDTEHWRAITSVFNGNGPDTTSFVLNQQGTIKQQQYVWVDKSNLLRQIARQDVITDEAEIYGRMFDPSVRAKVAAKLAPSLMVGQEIWYINGAQNMWSPPPPNTGSTASTGGALSNNTLWVIVTAKNFNGETLAWGISPSSATVPGALSLPVTAGGSTNTISFNIMRIANNITGGSGSGTALGSGWTYNVYIGTGSTQPANNAMWLQNATAFVNNTNPSLTGSHALDDPGGVSTGYMNVTMTGSLLTSGTAYSTVASNTAVVATSGGGGTPANQALMFDGLQSLTYLNAGTLNTFGEGGETAVVKRVSDATGLLAKTDLDSWLESMYFNAHANPECLLVGVRDHKAISNIVMNATNFRVNTNPSQQGLSDLIGGGRATGWVNQTTGRLMDVIMVPYLTQGTIIALSLTLPFSVAELDGPPLSVRYNKELWAREYPPDQSHPTQWMYAAFANETIRNEYLGGMGLLTGIVTA